MSCRQVTTYSSEVAIQRLDRSTDSGEYADVLKEVESKSLWQVEFIEEESEPKRYPHDFVYTIAATDIHPDDLVRCVRGIAGRHLDAVVVLGREAFKPRIEIVDSFKYDFLS